MTAISAFLRERLHFYLKDCADFAYDVVNAVLRRGRSNDVRDAIARAEALTAARGSEDFLAVSAAFKRIKNILRQAEEKGFALGSPKSVQTGAGGAATCGCSRRNWRRRWQNSASSATTARRWR